MTAADVQAILDARREEIVERAIGLVERQVAAIRSCSGAVVWGTRAIAEHIARNLVAALPAILGSDAPACASGGPHRLDDGRCMDCDWDVEYSREAK